MDFRAFRIRRNDPGRQGAFGGHGPGSGFAGVPDRQAAVRQASRRVGGGFLGRDSAANPAIAFLYHGYLYERLHAPGVLFCGAGGKAECGGISL